MTRSGSEQIEVTLRLGGFRPPTPPAMTRGTVAEPMVVVSSTKCTLGP